MREELMRDSGFPRGRVTTCVSELFCTLGIQVVGGGDCGSGELFGDRAAE